MISYSRRKLSSGFRHYWNLASWGPGLSAGGVDFNGPHRVLIAIAMD